MMNNVKQQGITLIELLIVIVIVSVLAAIIYPNFSNAARKAKRSDALKSIQEVAHKLEKHMSFCNQYTTQFGGKIGENASGDSCTGLGLDTATTNTLSSELGVYDLSIACLPAADNCMTYEITAAAKGSQTNDDACQSFTLSSTGARTAKDSSNNDSTSQCWS